MPTVKEIRSWLTHHGANEGLHYGYLRKVVGSIYELRYSWKGERGIVTVKGTLHEVKRVARGLMALHGWGGAKVVDGRRTWKGT